MASKRIVEEIRNRVSVVSLVGERVLLKKSGRNFKGLCPFHQEKTPSFMVSEEKQIFHCFGCSTGGDIFSFLMKIDGLTFPEALKELARKAGVKLPSHSGKGLDDVEGSLAKKKRWGYRLNEIARDFFIKNLEGEKSGSGARDYLKSRGVGLPATKELFLGFADKGWEGLYGVLKNLKAPMTLAGELGLVKKREGSSGYFDFFRDRLIFPILDIKGNILGFGGRILEKGEGAKYINSADSFLYNKSGTVYGLHWSKEAIRSKNEVILVEGYFDWITLWQAGIQNGVAPCGTAITIDQLRLLSRTTQNFVLAFDGDASGRSASFRSLPLFLELGLTPRLLLLPENSDPDSFLKAEGVGAFEKLKKNSKTLFECFIDSVVRNTKGGTAGTLEASKEILPLLRQVKDPMEQGIYRRQVAEKLGVDESDLKRGVTSLKPSLGNLAKNPLPAYPEEEKLLLAAIVFHPKSLKKIGNIEEVFTHENLREFAKQLLDGYAEEDMISFPTALEKCGEPLAPWIREMALVEEGDVVWEKMVEDCLGKINDRNRNRKLCKLNQEISQAEVDGNDERLLQLLIEKTKLTLAKKGPPDETAGKRD